MSRLLDLTGQIFGRLTVLRRYSNSPSGMVRWACRCECSKETIATTHELRSGDTRSCGCLRLEVTAKRSTKHGQQRRSYRTAEYLAWVNLRNRCSNPRVHNYHRYGGRGITVCPEWLHSFENFFAAVGKKPTPKHSIDRINNDGNYEPGNVRWATKSEQAYNRGQPCKS